MTGFADTNWVVATYFIKKDAERTGIVERFMRRYGRPLVISHVVLLECLNVFAWTAKQKNPVEWRNFQAAVGREFLVDTMQWDLLRQKSTELFAAYSHKAKLGTFDVTLVASALLTGAQIFLSFDSQCKVLAAAQRLKVYPELTAQEKEMLYALRQGGEVQLQ